MARAKQDSRPVTEQLIDAFAANTDRYYIDRKLFDPVYDLARQRLRERQQQSIEAPLPCHADFDAAFTDGQRFLTEHGGILPVAVREVGRLVVTSGRIIVCDPSYGSGRTPLERTISPGKYPVVLSSADGRICCAMLRLRKRKVVRWEMAVWPGQSTADLEGDDYYGYGVDAGTAAFLDADQDARLDQLYEDDRGLFDHRARTRDDPFAGEWAERVFDEQSGGNLLAFTSGYGDGRYASYWGLDSKGEPVCLVTDFNMLVERPYVNFFLSGVFSRPAGEVRHRALDGTGLIMEILPGRVPGRSLIVGFYGAKAGEANAELKSEAEEFVQTEPSDLSMRARNGLTYSYREYVVPADGPDPAGLGLMVYLPLPVTPLLALGVGDTTGDE